MLEDQDMYLFFENGIRGGVSMITHRYAKANHPEMPDYEPKNPLQSLIYLDSNNLYGWAMSCALPTHNFRWMTDEEI